jgi:hypothetical protein
MGNLFTRRQIVFGALLALLAIVMAVGNDQIASAAPKPVDGYGSREAFERACIGQGGSLAYGLGGELACRVAGGSIVCDERGNNCLFYPSAPRNGGQSAGADDTVVVIGTGPGLKEPGGMSSIELPGGFGGSSDGDVDGGSDGNVSAP